MDIAGMLLKAVGIDDIEEFKASAVATVKEAIEKFEKLDTNIEKIVAQNNFAMEQNRRILAMLQNEGFSEGENDPALEADPELSPQQFESASVKLIENHA